MEGWWSCNILLWNVYSTAFRDEEDVLKRQQIIFWFEENAFFSALHTLNFIFLWSKTWLYWGTISRLQVAPQQPPESGCSSQQLTLAWGCVRYNVLLPGRKMCRSKSAFWLPPGLSRHAALWLWRAEMHFPWSLHIASSLFVNQRQSALWKGTDSISKLYKWKAVSAWLGIRLWVQRNMKSFWALHKSLFRNVFLYLPKPHRSDNKLNVAGCKEKKQALRWSHTPLCPVLSNYKQFNS